MIKKAVLFLFVIGQSLAIPSEPVAAEQNQAATVEQTSESATQIPAVYDQTLDTAIRWAVFSNFTDHLEKYKGKYSAAAGDLVEEIKTLYLDSRNDYFNATRPIYNWCSETIVILEALNNTSYDLERGNEQEANLFTKLTERIEAKYKAAKKLSQRVVTFIEILIKLDELLDQLKRDEGQQMQDFYSTLKSKVHLAILRTSHAMDTLTNDIKTIVDMNKATRNTYKSLPKRGPIDSVFDDAVKRLADECHNYRDRHSERNHNRIKQLVHSIEFSD